MGKRLVDFVGASVALIVTSPFQAAAAITVYRQLGSPVLYRQRRPGINGLPFTLLKFRTMRDAVDSAGCALPDDQRLTPLGRHMRATSIDELPALWNVLRGDMSLVGPRPLLMEYLPLYSTEQARRHEVRPGITGWAQVNGRNSLDWEEKFALDVWYVDHVSFQLDLLILLRTVAAVVRRRGISAPDHATAPKFTGKG